MSDDANLQITLFLFGAAITFGCLAIQLANPRGPLAVVALCVATAVMLFGALLHQQILAFLHAAHGPLAAASNSTFIAFFGGMIFMGFALGPGRKIFDSFVRALKAFLSGASFTIVFLIVVRCEVLSMNPFAALFEVGPLMAGAALIYLGMNMATTGGAYSAEPQVEHPPASGPGAFA